MTDVFISYSHRDFKYAHRLADELKSHHIDVWIDDRIDYGDQWPRTIQENLAACQTFIVIMSTNAFNSMWVQNEVSYAQATHKTIFPLLLDGEVWLSMAAMQHVDVRAGQMPPSRFFEKVQKSLNQSAPRMPPRKADETPAVQPHATERVPDTRQRRTGLFLAGSLLVFAVVAGILYSVLGPEDGATPLAPTQVTFEPTESPLEPDTPGGSSTEPPITEESPTEPSITEPSLTDEGPTENILSAEGKLTLLRIHDVGTGYGPLDVEVVIKLDSEPNKAFGFQLRNNVSGNTNGEMLELLRDAFNRGGRVSIDYSSTGKNNGIIVRVINLP